MFKSIYLNIATYLLYLFCMQSYSDAVKMHQIIWKEITSFFSIHGVLLQRGYYIKRSGCGKKICKKNHCAERSFTTRNKIRKVWKNEMFLIVVFFFPMGRSMAKAIREYKMVQLSSCSVCGKIYQLMFHQTLSSVSWLVIWAANPKQTLVSCCCPFLC